MRKITSMTMLVSLVLLLLNSIVLYIVPEGRVAHWADWHFWGLSKTEWGNQHLTVGTLFLLAGILHIYYNWRAITSYLKNKMKAVRVFTPPFNIGFLITLLVAVGTYFHIPPMSTVVDFGVYLKEQEAQKLGSPPYGRAELSSLKIFCQKETLDLDQAVALLNTARIQVASVDHSLADIAKANGTSPQHIHLTIMPAKKVTARVPVSPGIFPGEPPEGFGKKTLEEFCAEFGLDYLSTSEALRANGLRLERGETIRTIANRNTLQPVDIYQIIGTTLYGE